MNCSLLIQAWSAIIDSTLLIQGPARGQKLFIPVWGLGLILTAGE